MSRSLEILLAEDDPNISTIAQISLEQVGGHRLTLADDGERALEILRVRKFDVVLLDEMMPKLNGIKVCQEYKRCVINPAPVIFLSAKSQDSDIQEFLALATGYIPKPFDPMELPKLIENILDQSRSKS